MADLPESLDTTDTRADHITHHETLHAFHNLFDLGAPNTGDVLTWDGVDWAAAPPTSGASGEQAFTNILYVRPSGSDSESGLSWENAKASIAAAVAAGADVIYLSPGRHAVASPITLTDPIRIVGPDTGALYEDYDAATASIYTTAATALASYFVDEGGASFVNITFELGSATQTLIQTAAVTGTADGLTLTSCRIMRSPDAPSEAFFVPVYMVSTVDASNVSMFDCHSRSSSLASITSTSATVTGCRFQRTSGVAHATATIPWLNLGTQQNVRFDQAATIFWGGTGSEVIRAEGLAGSHISGLGCRNMVTPYKAVDLIDSVNNIVEYTTGPNTPYGYVYQDSVAVQDMAGFSWGQWYDSTTHNSYLIAGPQVVYVPPPPEPPPPGDSPAALPDFTSYPSVPASYVSATPSNFASVMGTGANVVLEDGTYYGTLPLRAGQTVMARNPLQAVFYAQSSSQQFLTQRGATDARVFGIKALNYMRTSTWSRNQIAVDCWTNTRLELGWMEIAFVNGVAVRMDGTTKLHDTIIHDCSEYAIASGWGTLVERLEAYQCGQNTFAIASTNDRGFMKIAISSATTIRDLTVRDCWHGPWWDIQDRNVILDRFYVRDTGNIGVFLEVSYGPMSVSNGLIDNCGYRQVELGNIYHNQTTPAGLLISLTPDITVDNVTVQNCYAGITNIEWNHPQLDPALSGTDKSLLGCNNNNIYNCHVSNAVGRAYGFGGANQSGTRPIDILYQDCTYDSGTLATYSGVTFNNVVQV